MKIPVTESLLVRLGLKRIKSGASEIKAICPFHAETKPSWSINRTSGLWRCYGCREKGDLPSLVLRVHSHIYSYREAIQWIKDNTGISIVTSTPPKVIEMPDTSNLVDSDNPLFRRRGILFCKRGNLAGRHLIPIEVDGEVVAHEARDFSGRSDVKTLPVPSTVTLASYLYNIDYIYPQLPVYLVEGTKDVLWQVVNGFDNLVGSFGSHLYRSQINLLYRRGVKIVVMMYDADKAGVRAMRDAYAQLAPLFTTWLKLLPKGNDPADIPTSELVKLPIIKDSDDISRLIALPEMYRTL